MKTALKIFLGFFSTLLCSCYTVAKDSKEKSIVNYNASVDSAKTDTKCFIDTSEILANKNLQPLITELENTNLEIYYTTKSIPPFILNFLKCSKEGSFSIANPGERWQAGDAIVLEEQLLERQLIFFGVSNNIALMTYYTGGIVRSQHFLIFKLTNNIISDFWFGVGGYKLFNKKEILKYLKRHKDKQQGLNSSLIYF